MSLRLIFGGDTDAAKGMLPTARKFLNNLKNRMGFNDLKQDQQTINMADGTVFKVKRVFDQDTIDIIVPTPEVVEKKIEEKITTPLKYKIKITNIKTQEIVDTSCLMRMAVYSKEATDLEDNSYIYFDYKVPTDTDEDGNLETEPEEYFGSEENPGLDWDDENECFVIDAMFIDNPILKSLSYADALGTGELDNFLVYSCKDCVLDKYKGARTDQQYPEIVDDKERWQEEHLVRLSPAEEILEDDMSCVVQSFIMAYLGSHRVVWDATTGGYAQGIIDSNGDEIFDADWPVYRDDLNNFEALTNSIGSASIFGDEVNPYIGFVLPQPPLSPNCVVYEGGSTEPSYYDPPIPGDLINTFTRTTMDCTTTYTWTVYSSYSMKLHGWYAIYTTATIRGEMNGFTVYIYTTMGRESHGDYFATWYPDEDVIFDGYAWSTADYTVTSPWGNTFESLMLHEHSSSHSGESPETCSGYSWVEDSTSDKLDKMKVYHYKSDNIIFFIVTNTYFKNKYNIQMFSGECQTYYGALIDTDNGINSVGTLGYYSEDKCNTIDPNKMRACPDIKEGMNNLAWTYYNVYWGDGEVRIINPYFSHREGAI